MRLSALCAMAVAATAVNVQDQTEIEEASSSELQAAAVAAMKEAMATDLDVDHEDVEVGANNLTIHSAYYEGRNVLRTVISLYEQGKRKIPASCKQFGGSCFGNKRLYIKYYLNGVMYGKSAYQNAKNDFIKLPGAPKPKPKPAPAPVNPGYKAQKQRIIRASQNDCGYWCKSTGGPLATVLRKPNSDWSGNSCTYSDTTKAGNWLSVGIPETREITTIKILSRSDRGQKRLKGASVFAGWKVCGTFTNDRQLRGWATFTCPAESYADRISVVQPRAETLTVCGIEIFGK